MRGHRKMYRHVVIDENNCYLQLILWRLSLNQPHSSYRLCTGTCGENPVSFSATRRIKILIYNVENYDPRIATLLRKIFMLRT